MTVPRISLLWIPVIVLAWMALWAFAPVLLFVALLLAALGLVAAAMIALARRLRAWHERR
jgi:hypothetical protein